MVERAVAVQWANFFSNIWTNMMNNPVLTGIVDMICSLWENLSTTLQGIWNGIKDGGLPAHGS